MRSHCPLNFTLELLGDRWSLLLLRDVLIVGKRRFSELLESPEGIATNILSERLQRLQTNALLQRRDDPDDARRAIYEPTEKALALLPAILELIRWGATHDPDTSAPPAFVQRIFAERDAVVAEIRSRHGPSRRPAKARARPRRAAP